MKRATLGLLCLLVLFPAAAFAQTRGSISSFGPTSFYSYEFEQNATIHGVDLFGDFYGAPNSDNIFLSTQLRIEGPIGTVTEDISGGFRQPDTQNDTIFVAIPDSTLQVEGRYSVTIVAHDDTGDRLIGPVYYDVVPRPGTAIPPVLLYPEVVVGEADSATGGHPTFEVTSFSYVDPTPPPVNCNHLSGSFFPLGDTTVTCTATDSVGTATASFLVVVSDTVAPTVNVPANIISTTPVVTFTVTGTDAVDGTISATCSPASGSTFNAGTTTVTCHATDSHANTGYGTFKVTVTGGANAPIITVPSDITAEAAGPAGTTVAFVATTTDNATITCTQASGSLFALGTTTVTCAATTSGGTSSDSFNVNVVDTRPPVLSLPGTINAGATSAAGAVVTYSATATDLVDGFFLAGCDHPSGSVFPIGTTSVACSATDNALNTASGAFLVIVSEDVTPPVLSLPSDITAEATGPNGATVTYTATANDNLDGPVPVTCTPASGSTFPLGLTTVQCTATDAHGNIGHGSFTVTVRDTTPPVLSLPANITAEATGASGAAVTYSGATATDLVDGPRPVSCDHASGSTFPLGTTTVQCTATDTHNNIGHGSFTITVRDTTPPTLSLPASITAEATGPGGAAVDYSATATDLVDGSRPVTCDQPSGSTFPLGATTVQCTATDTHNNTAHGSFVVTVRDTTPPVIASVTASPKNLWPPNHQMVNVTVNVIASDLVDPAPMSHIIAVSSNQPIDGTGDGDTAPDWLVTGPLTLQLRSERASGIQRIYTITIATTDANGNTSYGTVNVTVGDGRGRAVH
jgi:hypothetical protein